jgi:mannose-6-phosphate isomerase-like protein (cupin superfamily)
MDRSPVYSVVMDMLPVDRDHAEHLMLGTDEITVLATGDQTGGAILAVEIRMPPGGGPPVMHRHEPSEIYQVSSGEFAFYVGEPDGSVRRVVAGAGDVVTLAGGTPHTIRNEGDEDAVAFVVHSPAAVMEGFSRAVAAMAAESPGSPPSMAEVLAVAERHGVELLGPVPALA